METVIANDKTITDAWALDKSHAKLGFTVTHMLVSEVEGSFKNFDIKLIVPNEDFHDAGVELTADVSSIDTQNDHRDAHLKKEDFFNVAKHPTLEFKQGRLHKKEDGLYELKGSLTMLGVTKPLTLSVKSRMGKNPMSGNTIAGFKVTGLIKRSDFGLAPSAPSMVVSDEIEINANAEFIKS